MDERSKSEAESAQSRVIKLTGYGEKRMRDAIAQGLIEGEMRSDMERTIRDAECTRRENKLLRKRNIELEAIRRDNMAAKAQAYEAWSHNCHERRRSKSFAMQMAIAGFVIGIAAGSLILAIGMLAVR